MSKLQTYAKEIVGIDKIEQRLKDLEDKGTIPANISTVTQIGADGNGVGGGTSVNPNGSNPDPDGDGEENETSDRTAEDVFDNPRIGDRLDRLSDIYDCETGKKLNIGLDGTYKLPEGWEDPNHPPDDPSFTLGMYWLIDTGIGFYGATISAGIAAALAGGTAVAAYQVSGPGSLDVITSTSFSDGGYILFASRTAEVGEVAGDVGGTTIGPSQYLHLDCFGAPSGADAACAITVAPSASWPEGEDIQLAKKDGKFVPNPNQPDVPGKYKDGKQSSLDFCFGDDLSRHGTLEITNNNGFMLQEKDDEGAAIGKLQLYDQNDKLVQLTDPENVDLFRPK